ncbi:isocitrate lyase/phosphoenolpyruvate mutase family protein [Nocardiopsis exhalans]|uniref:Isocitrate lyase/phosphoenolpyruvate mutase family protein n=1 Tax=Nocardiopsis exhalans TaxID=163604 RepID=A0ABY5DGN1_9ACTN|nr:isocitrate lyase/phosphoenolpyruvate mutase family protein [Nocardiopsis exhalans]USY22941.1 isocitrate lyase/phosphoenolpyruvate mutase family protein [Nocardiopsis exhalans]
MDNTEQALRERGERFRELHRGPGAFVVANAWDAGTARLLAGLGFAALATTSAGLAHSLGHRDGAGLVSREQTLGNAAAIAAATDLPVSADLENGFADSPEEVARTVREAAGTGIVGGSIEDTTADPDAPIHEFGLAVERVRAAAGAARALPFPFTLTARAENFLYGRPDLEDTVRRLRAFEEAGADVLFAPGLPDADAVRTVCAAVERPVNVLAAGAAAQMSVAELGDLGARRVSLGSGLSRSALTAALAAAREVAEHGTFTRMAEASTNPEIHRLL